MIRKASFKRDHAAMMKIARTSKYTSDFSNHIFSGEAMYRKNWIRYCTRPLGKGNVKVGFYCVRHKVRAPETTLYFITVLPGWQGFGIGQELMRDLQAQCPNPRIILNVAKTNKLAIKFYQELGFKIEDREALKGEGIKMALEW